MKVADAEAKSSRGLKAAGRGVHTYRWRSIGVIGRKNQCAPVLATFVGCVWRASEDVMPFKDVGFGWVSDNEWWGV